MDPFVSVPKKRSSGGWLSAAWHLTRPTGGTLCPLLGRHAWSAPHTLRRLLHDRIGLTDTAPPQPNGTPSPPRRGDPSARPAPRYGLARASGGADDTRDRCPDAPGPADVVGWGASGSVLSPHSQRVADQSAVPAADADIEAGPVCYRPADVGRFSARGRKTSSTISTTIRSVTGLEAKASSL